jgi:hypothetical protein
VGGVAAGAGVVGAVGSDVVVERRSIEVVELAARSSDPESVPSPQATSATDPMAPASTTARRRGLLGALSTGRDEERF